MEVLSTEKHGQMEGLEETNWGISKRMEGVEKRISEVVGETTEETIS